MQLVAWRINTGEAIANTALGLLNADQARTSKTLSAAGKAIIGGLLNQRPCCVAVTLRNPASSERFIEPSAFRLKIAGQTFVPAEYALADALPLTRLRLGPGEERTGTLVFMPSSALAAAADDGSGTTNLFYDRAAERKQQAAHPSTLRLRSTPH